MSCHDCGHHGDSQTNKPIKRDDRVRPLSHHELLLIKPQQAPALAIIYCKRMYCKKINSIYVVKYRANQYPDTIHANGMPTLYGLFIMLI